MAYWGGDTPRMRGLGLAIATKTPRAERAASLVYDGYMGALTDYRKLSLCRGTMAHREVAQRCVRSVDSC